MAEKTNTPRTSVYSFGADKAKDTRLKMFACQVLSVNANSQTILVDCHGYHDDEAIEKIHRIDQRLVTFNLSKNHMLWNQMASKTRLILPAIGISERAAYHVDDMKVQGGKKAVYNFIGQDKSLIVVTSDTTVQDLTVTKTIDSKTILRAINEGAADAPDGKTGLLGKLFQLGRALR